MTETSLTTTEKPSQPVELKPEVLDAYKLMLQYQFVGAICLIVLLTVGLLASYVISKTWDPPILVLVTLAGMLGAFFSALTRLYNVDELSVAVISPTVSRLGGRYLLMYSLVPPIVGAIASVVVYVTFVGGLIAGGVFPDMSCKGNNPCTSLVEVLNNYGPTDAEDYGKTLIWAFIAGFSERFVPDTLQAMIAKSQRQDTPS